MLLPASQDQMSYIVGPSTRMLFAQVRDAREPITMPVINRRVLTGLPMFGRRVLRGNTAVREPAEIAKPALVVASSHTGIRQYGFHLTGSAAPAVPDGWLWDFGDGSTGTGATPSHTYAAPGSYDVSVVVLDGFDIVGRYLYADFAVDNSDVPPVPPAYLDSAVLTTHGPSYPQVTCFSGSGGPTERSYGSEWVDMRSGADGINDPSSGLTAGVRAIQNVSVPSRYWCRCGFFVPEETDIQFGGSGFEYVGGPDPCSFGVFQTTYGFLGYLTRSVVRFTAGNNDPIPTAAVLTVKVSDLDVNNPDSGPNGDLCLVIASKDPVDGPLAVGDWTGLTGAARASSDVYDIRSMVVGDVLTFNIDTPEGLAYLQEAVTFGHPEYAFGFACSQDVDDAQPTGTWTPESQAHLAVSLVSALVSHTDCPDGVGGDGQFIRNTGAWTTDSELGKSVTMYDDGPGEWGPFVITGNNASTIFFDGDAAGSLYACITTISGQENLPTLELT